MTIANELLAISPNANDAMSRAQDVMTDIEQDWENEATFYTFSDSSVLLVSGPQLNAFEDIGQAKKEYLL